MPKYHLNICRHCRQPVEWQRRGRGYGDFGWYCSNHRADGHPENFHGYLVNEDVEVINVVPNAVADKLEQALFDAQMALQRLGEHGYAGDAEAARTEYQEAVSNHG